MDDQSDVKKKTRREIKEALESRESDSDKIRRLEAQVFQLKNIITKLTGQTGQETSSKKANRKKKCRPFDFSLYCKRHVLLHICYFGWDYYGFAVQETTGQTIESELFKALTVTRLIESRETSNYHRCGRTDKGVSAFHQVVSIDLRSNVTKGKGVFTYPGCKATEKSNKEIDYCKVLNANLPSHIQIIGWAACPDANFSARFDCTQRTYKYFFPRANLDLQKINEAGQHLVGEHDYRNFCKMDVANGVVNYHRRIFHVQADSLNDGPNGGSYDMCALTVKGKAFLWHQIRCVVAVLFRIGAGNENPDVIKQLLDVNSHPRRPQYQMASELPLNLFDCTYPTGDLDWVYEPEAMEITIKQTQQLWTEHAVKAEMLRTVLKELEGKQVVGPQTEQMSGLLGANKVKEYVPLMEMMKCPSLEEKLKAPRISVKRKRLNDDDS